MRTEPESFLEHLRGILANPNGLLAPLYHPLGFVSCVIPCEDERVKLRLHYWPASGRRVKNPSWPVHTHNYRLSSLVLRGEIVDSQYVISGDNEGRSCIYEVSYTGEDSIIVDTGRKCSLHEISKKVWSPGQKYVVDKGVFHESSVALNQSAVTFVCLSHKGDEPPLVVGDAAGGSFPYDRAAFEGEEFWSNVNESLAELMIRPDVNY